MPRKVYPRTTITAPVTLPVAADLGGNARRQMGIIENLGGEEYALTLTLAGQSVTRRIWPGARYLLPCDVSALTITPGEDGEATYQVEVSR